MNTTSHTASYVTNVRPSKLIISACTRINEKKNLDHIWTPHQYNPCMSFARRAECSSEWVSDEICRWNAFIFARFASMTKNHACSAKWNSISNFQFNNTLCYLTTSSGREMSYRHGFQDIATIVLPIVFSTWFSIPLPCPDVTRRCIPGKSLSSSLLEGNLGVIFVCLFAKECSE